MKLLTSVCNDRYLPGLLVFLHSFKKHHPHWSYPFKIYHRDDLSERSIDLLKRIYPGISFELITDPNFCGKHAHYMCLLPFKEIDYEQVIFLDCDMLCLGAIDEILEVRKGFAACLGFEFQFPKRLIHNIPWYLRPLGYLNTGVFSVKKPLLSESTFGKLVQEIEKNMKSKTQKLWDQDIINAHLRFADKSLLPFTLNAQKNLFKTYFNPKDRDVRIIHYTGGAKPWYTPGNGFLPLEGRYLRYKPIHDLWHLERQDFIATYHFDPMASLATAPVAP